MGEKELGEQLREADEEIERLRAEVERWGVLYDDWLAENRTLRDRILEAEHEVDRALALLWHLLVHLSKSELSEECTWYEEWQERADALLKEERDDE